jgi:hypothetical protein
MADKHPYMSGSAGLVQTTNHLRKSFPAQVAAETLKKLGIASNNETYVINILRFIKVLDDEGKKTTKANSVFTKHDDEEFQKGLAEMVEAAYSDLFALHGEQAWELAADKLISYFRSTDHTSAIVGQRQASTFQALAGLCGHGQAPAQKTTAPVRRTEKKLSARKPAKEDKPDFVSIPEQAPIQKKHQQKDGRDVGLTVRIEINLPAAGDQETYDRIFKSIRENLLNGE